MMFKRKLFVLGVFALAVVTIVGSGFSAWSFTKARQADISTGVVVTRAVAFGSIDVKESGEWRLLLDQKNTNTNPNGGISLQKANTNLTTGVKSSAVMTDGNFIQNTGAAEMVAVWYVPKTSYDFINPDEDKDPVKNTALKYYMNVYVKRDTIGTYIGMNGLTALDTDQDISNGSHVPADYIQYQIELTANATGSHIDLAEGTVDKKISVSVDAAGNSVEETYKAGNYYVVTMTYKFEADSLFVYQDGKKPTSFAEYQNMVQKIKAVPRSEVAPYESFEDVPSSTPFYIKGDDLIFEFQVVNTLVLCNI